MTEAITSCETAVALWRDLGEPLREGDALRRLSRYHWMCSNNDGAERAARESLDVLENLPAGPELAMAYAAQAQLGMLLDEAERTMVWGERAIALARDIGCTASAGERAEQRGQPQARTRRSHWESNCCSRVCNWRATQTSRTKWRARSTTSRHRGLACMTMSAVAATSRTA